MQPPSSWTRDAAPTFVVDRHFNSCGGLHDDYAERVQMARAASELTGVRRFSAPIALEGSALHTDGRATVPTTADVVLDERRNPGLTRADGEEVLRLYFGVEKVIWLVAALEDAETGGHVDTLACFVAPGVVVALSCEDSSDPQFEPLRENIARLEAATTTSGRRLEVATISHAQRRLDDDAANGAVVMPGFDDPHNAPAREAPARLFSERDVVRERTAELARLAGNVHCMTRQQPLT